MGGGPEGVGDRGPGRLGRSHEGERMLLARLAVEDQSREEWAWWTDGRVDGRGGVIPLTGLVGNGDPLRDEWMLESRSGIWTREGTTGRGGAGWERGSSAGLVGLSLVSTLLPPSPLRG